MWWKILLIIFALIILLLCQSVHIVVGYDGEFSLKVGLGLIKLDALKLIDKMMGGKKKDKKKDSSDKSEDKKKDKKGKKEENKDSEKKKDSLFKAVNDLRGVNGIVDLTVDLARLLGSTTDSFRKHLVFRKLIVNYNVTGSDAAETALKFGRISAVFFPNLGILCSIVKVRKKEINFVPDFLGSKSNQQMVIHISYRIIAILSVVLGALFGYLKVNNRHKSINARINQRRTIKNKQEQAV